MQALCFHVQLEQFQQDTYIVGIPISRPGGPLGNLNWNQRNVCVIRRYCSRPNCPHRLGASVGQPSEKPRTSGAAPLRRAMNPSDFKGLYFYKLLIPAFTWGSILGTFLGPFFFPEAWFLFVAAFMVVFVLVSLSQVHLLQALLSYTSHVRALVSCLHSSLSSV